MCVGHVDRTKNLVHLENLDPAVSRQVMLACSADVYALVDINSLHYNTVRPH